MLTLVLELARRFWPHLAAIAGAMALGAFAAWQIQGLRLDAADSDLRALQLEFDSYRASLRAQEAALAEQREIAREQSRTEYRRVQDELEKQIAQGDAYRRCVAAGKCGARVQYVPAGGCGPTLRAPSAGGADASGADAIPAAGDPAAAGVITAGVPEVVADCARTTLQLNRLQAGIEAQPGYEPAEEAAP